VDISAIADTELLGTTIRMTRLITILLLIFPFLFDSCNNLTNQKNEKETTCDTTKSFKIDNHWITPKLNLQFNSLLKSAQDTLDLVICTQYIYFPFGLLYDKSDLPKSLLKSFRITKSDLDTFTNYRVGPNPFNQWSESIELELGSNKLNLFLDNDPEASTHSYILGGEIIDNKVELLNKIKNWNEQ
jgi:hypothetical protein